MAENFNFNSEVLGEVVDPGVTRRIMAYCDELMMCELSFDKGAVGKLHHHPHTQMTYIVSGSFEFEIGGVRKVVTAGDVLYKQPNIEHGAVCLEKGKLVDVFTPMREDFIR